MAFSDDDDKVVWADHHEKEVAKRDARIAELEEEKADMQTRLSEAFDSEVRSGHEAFQSVRALRAENARLRDHRDFLLGYIRGVAAHPEVSPAVRLRLTEAATAIGMCPTCGKEASFNLCSDSFHLGGAGRGGAGAPVMSERGLCIRCEEPVLDTEEAEQRAVVTREGASLRSIHRECAVRSVLGSVGHLQGRCGCYGGKDEDPPGLTRRQAAIAAHYFAMGMQRGGIQ